ncbi:carbohydrate ABC transporter permease [Microbacterium aquimaris]|uniref:Sugar ABC transporter permease n=1 Tax=Microbacterium aquimaris TaxID=459816 RepID=A0ABU5N406_9MICO|nr:sugar ABC transporter permease [Microbacterium aquimaris]MDZ8160817.1 sugar ABC transporter permease [Microbacterium aquimaris]MDZ8275256.1 sugar ABC transporter permease [Microbacterium aquimaris]
MSQTAEATRASSGATAEEPRRKRMKSPYPMWFHAPAGILYFVLFAVPTFASFYFALTRWTLFDVEFIGLDNFVQFFSERQFLQSLTNTFIYAVLTATAKVVLGFLLALLLTSQILGQGFLRSTIFFPVLVSTIGIGLTFKVLLDPFDGLVNESLAVIGIDGPGWLTDPSTALLTVVGIDIWKGVGIATLIFIAGLSTIPREYYEAARVDGAGGRRLLWHITLPLVRPAMATVVILSLIGGLRSFDLIWATTGGGPGFSSDVLASVIYKQYQAGFYGLSTAGNVVLFLVVAAVIFPLSYFLNRRNAEQ